MTRNHSTDYLFLLLLALIWSASFTLIKIGVSTIAPFTLTAARMLIAAMILSLCLAVKKTKLPLNRRALLLYFMVGLIGNVLPFTFINWGEIYINSSLASIMIGAMPICTFVLAHYFLPDESMTMRKVFGLCLGFGGLLTIVGWSVLAGVGSAHVLGQLAVLVAAISYGITTVFVRSQQSFGGIEMATGATLVGSAIGIPLAFLFEDPLSDDAECGECLGGDTARDFSYRISDLVVFPFNTQPWCGYFFATQLYGADFR